MCVCVIERYGTEKERERERERGFYERFLDKAGFFFG